MKQGCSPLKSPNRKLSEHNSDIIIRLLHSVFIMTKVFSYTDSQLGAFLLGRDNKISRGRTRIHISALLHGSCVMLLNLVSLIYLLIGENANLAVTVK